MVAAQTLQSGEEREVSFGELHTVVETLWTCEQQIFMQSRARKHSTEANVGPQQNKQIVSPHTC